MFIFPPLTSPSSSAIAQNCNDCWLVPSQTLSLHACPCPCLCLCVSLIFFLSSFFHQQQWFCWHISSLCPSFTWMCTLASLKCKPFVNVSSLFHISRLLFFFKSQTSSSPSWFLQMTSLCVHHPSHEWHFLPFKSQVLCALFSSLLHILSRILFTKSRT